MNLFTEEALEKNFFEFKSKRIDIFKVLYILFTFGFVVGVSLFGIFGNEFMIKITPLVEGYIKNIYLRGIFSNFFLYYLGYSFFIFADFFAGLCPIGQFIAFFVPFMHGLSLGSCTTYLYLSGGLKGIIFCFICLAPCEVIYSLCLILASKTSILFSNEQFKRLFPKKYIVDLKSCFKLYLMRFLVLFLFEFVAIFLNILLRYIFTGIIF